ncbi:MAG: hypothetical protein HY782_00675 [Chloroflexi bacterium]|nr:hypothetical protein [Chloroflexota bacterium]
MNLSSLLRALPAYQIENERDVEITHITSDSRQVAPGALFVAYPGVKVDPTTQPPNHPTTQPPTLPSPTPAWPSPNSPPRGTIFRRVSCA